MTRIPSVFRVSKLLFVILMLASAVSVYAVAIDDSINPQNCNRTDPACAKFVDTTSVGQVKWGAFIAGGLRSLTNLFVDGKLGIGTLRPSTGEKVLKLDVEGSVGAKFYCDENGNHCVAGNALNTGTGSSTNVSISLTNGGGIILNPTTITNTGIISIDTDFIQKRVAGVCTGTQAIKQVNQDGTVVCQAVGGTVNSVSLTGGNGIIVTPSPITSTGAISIDVTKTQSRVNGTCPANQAIRVIAQDGTVTCQSVTSSGTNLPEGVRNQTLRFISDNVLGVSDMLTNTGSKIGVGTTNPETTLHIKGTSITDGVLIENPTEWAFLAIRQGNLANSTVGIGNWKGIATYKATLGGYNGAGGIGAQSAEHVFKTYDPTNGNQEKNALIIDYKGRVGINTNPDAMLDVNGSFKLTDGTQGANKVLTSDASGKASWKDVPASTSLPTASANQTLRSNGNAWVTSDLLNNDGAKVSIGMPTSALSADYKLGVNGNASFAGTLRIQGGSPAVGKVLTSDAAGLASWKAPAAASCSVCISAYDQESNTWSTFACSANGAESAGTGFSGSKSIEKVKVKMQCN